MFTGACHVPHPNWQHNVTRINFP
jgi:hypothetical protein